MGASISTKQFPKSLLEVISQNQEKPRCLVLFLYLKWVPSQRTLRGGGRVQAGQGHPSQSPRGC